MICMKKDGATWNRDRQRRDDLESSSARGKNQQDYTAQNGGRQGVLVHSRPTPYGGVGIWQYPNGLYAIAAYTYQDEFYGVVWTQSSPFALKEEERIREYEINRYKQEQYHQIMAMRFGQYQRC